MKQFHVLVLGLDVLGNPYGLISEYGQGVKDLFYEPYLVSRTSKILLSPLLLIVHKYVACEHSATMNEFQDSSL